MMFYKSPNFWITIVCLGLVGGLAFLGKVGGDAALGAILGVAGGWGISAKGASK